MAVKAPGNSSGFPFPWRGEGKAHPGHSRHPSPGRGACRRFFPVPLQSHGLYLRRQGGPSTTGSVSKGTSWWMWETFSPAADWASAWSGRSPASPKRDGPCWYWRDIFKPPDRRAQLWHTMNMNLRFWPSPPEGTACSAGVGIRTEGHQEVIRSRPRRPGVMWAICPAFSGPLDILRPSSWYLNAR